MRYFNNMIMVLLAVPLFLTAEQLSPEDRTIYEESLLTEVSNAGANLQAFVDELGKGDRLISIADRAKLEYLMMLYNTKATLANNFIGTPSLNSSKVRAKLTAIMTASNISVGDLAELQFIVQQYYRSLQQQAPAEEPAAQ